MTRTSPSLFTSIQKVVSDLVVLCDECVAAAAMELRIKKVDIFEILKSNRFLRSNRDAFVDSTYTSAIQKLGLDNRQIAQKSADSVKTISSLSICGLS